MCAGQIYNATFEHSCGRNAVERRNPERNSSSPLFFLSPSFSHRRKYSRISMLSVSRESVPGRVEIIFDNNDRFAQSWASVYWDIITHFLKVCLSPSLSNRKIKNATSGMDGYKLLALCSVIALGIPLFMSIRWIAGHSVQLIRQFKRLMSVKYKNVINVHYDKCNKCTLWQIERGR